MPISVKFRDKEVHKARGHVSAPELNIPFAHCIGCGVLMDRSRLVLTNDSVTIICPNCGTLKFTVLNPLTMPLDKPDDAR